jgi:hypothetical protein
MLLLLLLACCLCCRAAPKQVEVVEEVVEECEAVAPAPKPTLKVCEPDEYIKQLPEQTYYHAIGRSFPVVFNQRAFGQSTTATSEKYYGSLGKRCTVNFAGYNSTLPPAPAQSDLLPTQHCSSMPRLAAVSAANNYYCTPAGKQFAVAFSPQTFTERRNARSVLLTQPF